jgi:membrane-bound lytic murein transglycosylase B
MAVSSVRACVLGAFLVLAPIFWTLSPAAATPQVSEPAKAASAFHGFVERLWPLAKARGVSRETFDLAFRGVTPDQEVIDLTHRQSEFVKTIWEYLASAASQNRIERGGKMAGQYSAVLDQVEARYGVERAVVLGVWGLETNFGGFTGGKDVIRSLATLASVGYRGTYFRDELLAALVILEQHHVARAEFKGSWAGAMGQTQFMPSSFQKFAVDFDGDGKKDIWTNVPDALASTANYLRQNGWQPGLPWGFEVSLPHGFNYRLRDLSFAEWRDQGVRRADGQAMPQAGTANLFFPAGADGPVFLVTANFDVIKRYNASDAYALGVAHLGDRIFGASPIRAAWPVDDPILGLQQRIELQQALTRLGYDVGEPNGRIGSRTRDAIRDFQDKNGLRPDGYAGHRVLQALRGQ